MNTAATPPTPERNSAHPASDPVARASGVWDRVLAQLVSNGQAAAAAALTACTLTSGNGDRLRIRVPGNRDGAPLRHDPEAARDAIQAVLATLAPGLICELHLEEGDARRAVYRQAEAHPIVQSLRERFDAEVLALEPLDRAGWQRWLASDDGADADAAAPSNG